MSEFVSHRQYELFLKRIEKANLKAHGTSLSFGGMRAGDLIIEIQDDRGGMMMKDTWREDMRRQYLVPKQSSQEVLPKDSNWTPEHEALKKQAQAQGYYYWNKKESGGGIVYADHCIYNRDATAIVGRSYSENWAWIYAFRALGWLPEDGN